MNKHQRELDKAIKLLEANSYKNNYTQEALKLLKTMNAQGNVPDTINPVLAEVTCIGDLNTATWFEVIYYDTDDKQWCTYRDDDSFDEVYTKVLRWKYCDEALEK